jgi:hypothetical protein
MRQNYFATRRKAWTIAIIDGKIATKALLNLIFRVDVAFFPGIRLVSFRIISPTETDGLAPSDPIGKNKNHSLAITSPGVILSHSKNVTYFC